MNYEKLKKKHEAIRTILMDHDFVEYGDCIIDEISEAAGILPTTVYYDEKN
jgi:formamidopyrimidine-DNA glycosylase